MDFHTTFLRTLEEASSMLDKSRTVKVDSDLREINEKNLKKYLIFRTMLVLKMICIIF